MNITTRITTLFLTIGVGVVFVAPTDLFGSSPPSIDLWLDRGDGGVYYSGDAMTVYFKVDRPAYVTVYNVDTDGYVNILYPYYPGMDNYVAGERTYTIPGGGYELGLYIDESTGIGYVEAVVSDEPFYLEDWPFLSASYEAVDGVEVIRRITGDPFLSIEEINRSILPFSEELIYSDDFAIYYVDEVVHYPRYICSDCHVPSYYHYEPYHYHCSTYYIVVYDYWYYNDYCYWDFYYPYDYYGYYYRFPRSSHVGRRYTRKYDYRTRDGGVYQAKGERVLSPGAIRVRENDGNSRVRTATPVTVQETGSGLRTPALYREESIVRDNPVGIQPRTSHVRVNDENGDSRRDETVTRSTEVRNSSGQYRPRTATKVSVDDGKRSSQNVKRSEERIEGSDRNERPREYRSRNPERPSGGDRDSGDRTLRRPERVTEDRPTEVRKSNREPVRVRESRPEPRRDPEKRRSEPTVTRNTGQRMSRAVKEPGNRSVSRTDGIRSPSRVGNSQSGVNRGSGVRR
jgi:hypothetical protein